MIPLKVTIYHKGQGLIREVNKELFTVGRSLECDIHLNDNSISRVHVVVSVRANKIWIEDKNSSNGTFVNGKEIAKSVAVSVASSDQIQLGTSEYMMTVGSVHAQEEALESPEAEEPEGFAAPVAPVGSAESEEPEDDESVIDEVPPDPEESVVEHQKESPPVPSFAPKPSFEAEKVLHDAKKRAVQIVMESEAQAERKVQAIYEKARKTQEQAEVFYEQRVAEAHKEADVILTDIQKQGQDLLAEARTLSAGLREDVEGYIQSLRKKAKLDADEVIAEATNQAERIKAEAVVAGHEIAKKDTESLINVAREEAAKILEKAQKQVTETQEKLVADKEALDKLASEIVDAQKSLSSRQSEVEELTQREATLAETLKNEELALEKARATQQEIAGQRKSVDEAVNVLVDRQKMLTMIVQDLEERKVQVAKEAEAQKILLNEKLEKEKILMLKQTEEHSEELRLDLAKKMQKMEQDLVDDVIRRKSSLVKEIHNAVEKEVVQLVDAAKWRKISDTVVERINEAFDGKMATISQSTATTKKPVDLMKKRSNENLSWAAGGLLVGMLALFASQNVLERLRRDQTPMQTRVKNEAKQRQDDLEKRRFNPPQIDDLKETYVDSVIYTRHFAEIYLDQDYQQRLYRASAQYLLKTWRLEEEKSIQVLSAANALVKELIDKKAKIHPDFVKEGLEKMHKLEAETLVRMKDILGSEVRLESFRRFEHDFFMEELQRRRVAQH